MNVAITTISWSGKVMAYVSGPQLANGAHMPYGITVQLYLACNVCCCRLDRCIPGTRCQRSCWASPASQQPRWARCCFSPEPPAAQWGIMMLSAPCLICMCYCQQQRHAGPAQRLFSLPHTHHLYNPNFPYASNLWYKCWKALKYNTIVRLYIQQHNYIFSAKYSRVYREK